MNFAPEILNLKKSLNSFINIPATFFTDLFYVKTPSVYHSNLLFVNVHFVDRLRKISNLKMKINKNVSFSLKKFVLIFDSINAC
jgi:hypothetical protein